MTLGEACTAPPPDPAPHKLHGAYLNPVEACADGFAAGYAVDQPPNNYGYWLHYYSNYYDANIGRCMAWVSGNVVNTSLAIGIPGIARRSACPMGTTVATEYWGDAVQYWVPTSCNASCPVHSTLSGSACACDNPTASDPTNYVPDSAGTSCVPVPAVACPIPPLTPLTDPVALLYEDGTYSSTNPDIGHLTPTTQAGLACIQQKVIATNCNRTPQASSGYRPAAYQKHIYDVYTKWQEIKDNNTPECAEVKAAIEKEFDDHSPFAHAPGETSNHSQTDAQGNPAGTAVDISFVPDNALISADAIACQCNMTRTVPNDSVHYQPRSCPR